MSYFDFYVKNIINSEESGIIKGTCCSMCPPEEVALREKEKMVHLLEVVGSERKLVKSYSRSAADCMMAAPRLLRPFPVLRDTVHYLLLNVVKRVDIPLRVVYDFVNDRLRSVRQDMTIQRLPPHECMLLLDPMIRFYVYFGYMLCEHQIREYDPVLNQKYILECLKWFLSCCDTTDQSNDRDVDDMNGFVCKLDINGDTKLTCDRPLMESLYILCNMNDIHPLYRYLNLPSCIKSCPKVQLAYQIALANDRGNYLRVTRLMTRLCPLACCALSVYVPVLQRDALHKMSYSYNNRHLTVPTVVLTKWLLFNSEAEARAVCAVYGLTAEQTGIRFTRATFTCGDTVHPPRKLKLCGKFNLDTDHIFTYKT